MFKNEGFDCSKSVFFNVQNNNQRLDQILKIIKKGNTRNIYL